jgi:hypothetical protein
MWLGPPSEAALARLWQGVILLLIIILLTLARRKMTVSCSSITLLVSDLLT